MKVSVLGVGLLSYGCWGRRPQRLSKQYMQLQLLLVAHKKSLRRPHSLVPGHREISQNQVQTSSLLASPQWTGRCCAHFWGRIGINSCARCEPWKQENQPARQDVALVQQGQACYGKKQSLSAWIWALFHRREWCYKPNQKLQLGRSLVGRLWWLFC